MNNFNNLKEIECISCRKPLLINSELVHNEIECQNCYITKLELLKDKKADDEQENKVISIERGQGIQS